MHKCCTITIDWPVRAMRVPAWILDSLDFYGIPGHDGGERREHADEGAHSEPGGALCYSRQDKSLQRMSAN